MLVDFMWSISASILFPPFIRGFSMSIHLADNDSNSIFSRDGDPYSFNLK